MSTAAQKKLIQQYIFGGFEDQVVNEESLEEGIDKLEEEERFKGAKRPSAYVDVFENVAKTVIEHERHLLSDDELQFLEHFSELCYNARYCLVRLTLRKPGQWHTVSSLEKFKKEVEEDGLQSAIADLCKPIASLVKQEPFDDSHVPVKMEEVEPPTAIKTEPGPSEFRVKLEESGHEIIDLTMDEEDVKPSISFFEGATSPSVCLNTPGPSKAHSPPRPPALHEDPISALLGSDDDDLDLSFFCEDESAMSLQEILERLTLDQIKTLTKEMKCKLKPQAKKSDIIATLLSTAASQSILSFAPEVGGKSKGKAKDNGIRQTVLPFSSCKRPVNQSQRLKQMAMKLLGKCIRVNKDILRLVKRLHIIGYRVTEHPTALLLPELLSRFKKRSYTKVDHTRSNNIWTSREEVLAYEKALHLETLLDEVIEGPKDKDKVPQTRNQSRPPAKEPITSAGGKHLQTPLKMPATISNLRTPILPAVKGEDDLDQKVFNPPEDDLHDADIDVKKEVQVKRHIDKWLYSMCKESVTRYTSMGRVIAPGLERFCDAYVLFRMLGKAVRVLGSLKEYQQELEILEFMLSQRTWRRGKRGEWYRRMAVIYVHLIRLADTKEKRFDLQKACLLLLRNAVLDNDVGIVFLPDLINRLMKLEKTLKLPVEQQTTCEGMLLKPKTIEINARKISTPLRFDSLGRLIEEKENTPDLLAYMIPTKAFPKLEEPVLKKNTGKSCWQGKDGIVNVETIVLEHYEALGFKGFHSETRLLTTIFALLFWDIIFAKVPGAFETPFQFAPLDMFEDTFYHARKELIDARLKEIQEGDAGWQKILQRHDDAYREKRTWCIGIHWDLCSKEELFDILKCIGKDSLAFICKLFCQDYRGRQSGGPDLFVWKAQEGLCKFVEVKGPGDRPSEGQKYWFDSLRRANVEVEICRVVDECAKTEPPVTATKKRKSRTPGANPRRRSMPFGPASDDVDYDALDPEDSPAPDSNHGPSTRKRRRVSEPQTIYKAEHP